MTRRALSLQRSFFSAAVLALLASCSESAPVSAPSGVRLDEVPSLVFSISVNSGDNQSGTADSALSIDPSVVVRTAWGSPVAGVTVVFDASEGGHVAQASTVTNEQGIASAGVWTLGQAYGMQNLFARVVREGVRSDPVVMYAYASAPTETAPPNGPPVSLSSISATQQSAPANSVVTEAPSVVVHDADGRPVPNASVYFWVTSGGGQVTGASQTTNSAGVATVTSWLLGSPGTNTLNASIDGLAPATFTAIATVEQQPPAPPTGEQPPTTEPTPPSTEPAPPPTGEQPPSTPPTGEQPPTNTKPVASFTVTRAGTLCTLDGTASTDDGGVISYIWRSSDGFRPVKSGPVITRSCESGGSPWTEWLTVTDAAGLKDSTSHIISSASTPVPPPTGEQPPPTGEQPPPTGEQPPPTGLPTVVAVNSAVRFQTMSGWQANAQAGQFLAGYQQWIGSVLDLAAADNINRLRVDVRSGIENPRDAFNEWQSGAITETSYNSFRYCTVNDNTNPGVLDMSRFSFGELDATMSRVVMPLRQRLQARGVSLGLTMTYVSFNTCSTGQYAHTDPEEYAEFAVAVMNHVRERFGVIPDTWEIINEPDNTGGVWTATRLQAALIAIDRRLKQEGYQVALIAPSAAGAATALNLAQALLSSTAASLIDQVGYHRYDLPAAGTVQSLGGLAASRGISTAMTEHIGSGHDDLITDLTLGRVSTWEQYTLAFPTADNGGHYYGMSGSTATTGARTRYLRHYFRHVNHGAARIGATSALSSVVPVAFRNTNGLITVVMKYNSAGTITVGGLPAGRYSVGFDSETTNDGKLPDINVGSDGTATLTLQSRGVVVLYGRF